MGRLFGVAGLELSALTVIFGQLPFHHPLELVCHSFTESFLSLYSQAYLFCPADGSGRQERLFQIPSKLIDIGFTFSKDSIKGFTFGTDFEFNFGGSGDYDKYGDDDGSKDD